MKGKKRKDRLLSARALFDHIKSLRPPAPDVEKKEEGKSSIPAAHLESWEKGVDTGLD